MFKLMYQLNTDSKKKSNNPTIQDKKPILYHSIRAIADDSKSQWCALLAFYPEHDTMYLFSV